MARCATVGCGGWRWGWRLGPAPICGPPSRARARRAQGAVPLTSAAVTDGSAVCGDTGWVEAARVFFCTRARRVGGFDASHQWGSFGLRGVLFEGSGSMTGRLCHPWLTCSRLLALLPCAPPQIASEGRQRFMELSCHWAGCAGDPPAGCATGGPPSSLLVTLVPCCVYRAVLDATKGLPHAPPRGSAAPPSPHTHPPPPRPAPAPPHSGGSVVDTGELKSAKSYASDAELSPPPPAPPAPSQ